MMQHVMIVSNHEILVALVMINIKILTITLSPKQWNISVDCEYIILYNYFYLYIFVIGIKSSQWWLLSNLFCQERNELAGAFRSKTCDHVSSDAITIQALDSLSPSCRLLSTGINNIQHIDVRHLNELPSSHTLVGCMRDGPRRSTISSSWLRFKLNVVKFGAHVSSMEHTKLWHCRRGWGM